MRNDQDNLIVDLTFKFALTIIDYCEKLEKDKKYVLTSQLLKSETSIGANVRDPDPDKILEELQSIIRIISKIISHLNHNFQILKSSNF